MNQGGKGICSQGLLDFSNLPEEIETGSAAHGLFEWTWLALDPALPQDW